MGAALSPHRVVPAIAAFAVGIAVSWLAVTPFGLLAPVGALFSFARGRIALLLHIVFAIGLVGSLLVAAVYPGALRDLAAAWAAFFAVAHCIGAIVTTSASGSASAEAMPAASRSTTRSEASSYPVIGPTPREKVAPRDAPIVSVAAQDDEATVALLVATSFWGGTPFHLRYWRRLPEGSHRWIETSTESWQEPSGTRQWRGVSADIDDQKSGRQQPTKTASNPPNEDDAVRAAKVVERLLGNSWAFDAAGRPTYLTPFAQTFVEVTLDEFQAVVDEGHTFFKRTSHPDDYDRIADAWRHSLDTGEHFYIERRIRRATGIHDWSRTAIVPTGDSQGRITGWYGASIDLDAHRNVEAELLDRERELSQLVAMVPSHLWRLTPDGEPIFFNKRMVDFLGLDVPDTDRPGMSRLEAMIATVIHPDDATDFGTVLNHCLLTGDGFALRYRLRRADGVFRWMSSRAEPMRDLGGRIVQWYGLCHDIDDQVRAEDALRDRERELAQLVNMVPSLIWRLAPDGEPTFFNQRLIDFFGLDVGGYDNSDMSQLAAAIAAVVHPDDAASMREALKRSFSSGVHFSMKYRLRRADGVYRWMEGRAEPMRDESGRIVQWYGLAHDIDDRVHVEEALRQSERSLRQLVDTLPTLVWCTTPDGAPRYHSRQFRDFVGFISEDVTHQLADMLSAVIHPDDVAAVAEKYAHSMRTGELYTMKHRVRRFDGEYRWVESRAVAMRNGDGAIEQWNGVYLEIEDQVRAQEKLRLAQESLARASQAASLAELSASIAHEVNQPLAAIVANSHACHRWLSAAPANVERAKITAERIIRDANSAADVVSRIRALFRQSVETRSKMALGSVLAETRHLMAEEALRRRFRIDVDVESDLPPVALDPVQIQQVLINLIRNGMEATDSAAGDRIIGIRVRRMADVVQTEIGDRGRGVEHPDKIFEPFFTTKEHGMGMGLAICRSIVESHRGRLWVERNEPHGATFIFTLPVEVNRRHDDR